MSHAQQSGVVKLAVIPGDGIGPEVIAEAEKVLDAATAGSGIRFDKSHFSLGATRFLETGDTLTDADLASIQDHDAILLGAVRAWPGGVAVTPPDTHDAPRVRPAALGV